MLCPPLRRRVLRSRAGDLGKVADSCSFCISSSYISWLLPMGGAGRRRLASGREKLEYFIYFPLISGDISSNFLFSLWLQVQLDGSTIIPVSPVCPWSRGHSIVVACFWTWLFGNVHPLPHHTHKGLRAASSYSLGPLLFQCLCNLFHALKSHSF